MKPVYKRMVRKMNEAPAGEHVEVGTHWFLYILECADGTFYTGVTTDPVRRLAEHNAGRASRYTRSRRPVTMVYREECGARPKALSRECAVKSLSRAAKKKLIAGVLLGIMLARRSADRTIDLGRATAVK